MSDDDLRGKFKATKRDVQYISIESLIPKEGFSDLPETRVYTIDSQLEAYLQGLMDGIKSQFPDLMYYGFYKSSVIIIKDSKKIRRTRSIFSLIAPKSIHEELIDAKLVYPRKPATLNNLA